MRAIARFNKRVNNPLQRLWAAHLPYMAVIEHKGRYSGNIYRTPVLAFITDDKLSVVLNYGTQSDWVRNIQAAGSAEVVHRGKRYRLIEPRVLPLDSLDLPPTVRVPRAPSHSALHASIRTDLGPTAG
ncbi:hypothetical protein GCM10023321_24030 [Pseudonocardia eucalypti]|uniref:Nitroreductase family deazaflavin-dependent oxidoreductase n=1 Tax=Pseudonocardia eucalypti TaxID=648755 RepID=A0ABP9PX11_9PSEU